MRVLCVFGTRPEAIKMAPLILSLREQIETQLCVTGQHREMLDQVLKLFRLEPDFDLNLMRPNQSLSTLAGEVLQGVGKILQANNYDWVLVQGDTTSTMAAALAAFYHRVPVGHVEAGLRTYNLNSPYPEEMNRQVTSRVTRLHFAPTRSSEENLLREGVPQSAIAVTGNTVIDALHWVLQNVPRSPDLLPFGLANKKMILVTGHRRENFGAGFENICQALAKLASGRPELEIVYPVHLNPNVKEPVHRILGHLQNVHLLAPLAYPDFVHLMSAAYLILTDSGGVQEEAPSLGKPVLLMRDTTERPEAVVAGNVRIVGASWEKIVEATLESLDNPEMYQRMATVRPVYGDGRASERIRTLLQKSSFLLEPTGAKILV